MWVKKHAQQQFTTFLTKLTQIQLDIITITYLSCTILGVVLPICLFLWSEHFSRLVDKLLSVFVAAIAKQLSRNSPARLQQCVRLIWRLGSHSLNGSKSCERQSHSGEQSHEIVARRPFRYHTDLSTSLAFRGQCMLLQQLYNNWSALLSYLMQKIVSRKLTKI